MRSTYALIALALAGCVIGEDGTPSEDPTTISATWGPYDPMPGHPTVPERDAFVREVGPYAQEAERLYGTPAAALIAMTCNEGGFGWTKTAYNVNNIFGWKWYSAAGAGGRDYWILEDQPAWDPNNKYVVFADRRDAVLFVASKLALSDRYKPHTDKYKADLAAGTDVAAATNKWIYGIAYAGYNPFEHYPVTTIKFMKNYRTPSNTLSAVYNLYQYSKPTVAPWISIDTPASQATVGGDVTIASSASAGVTSVKFFTRAQGAASWYALGEDTAAPFAQLWPTAGWVANGNYELRVEAWQGTTLEAAGTRVVRVAN